jgi:hypothetical protein
MPSSTQRHALSACIVTLILAFAYVFHAIPSEYISGTQWIAPRTQLAALSGAGSNLIWSGSGKTSAPDDPAYGGMSMLTLSACIEQTTTNANGVEIIHKRRLSATNSSYTLQINASNQAVFSVTNQVPVAVYSRGNTNLPNNQRNHIAGVYDGSKMYVYQNGVNENTNGWNQTGSVFDSDGPMTTDYYSQFSGTIHDARVYDRALSVAEIQELSDTWSISKHKRQQEHCRFKHNSLQWNNYN